MRFNQPTNVYGMRAKGTQVTATKNAFAELLEPMVRAQTDALNTDENGRQWITGVEVRPTTGKAGTVTRFSTNFRKRTNRNHPVDGPACVVTPDGRAWIEVYGEFPWTKGEGTTAEIYNLNKGGENERLAEAFGAALTVSREEAAAGWRLFRHMRAVANTIHQKLIATQSPAPDFSPVQFAKFDASSPSRILEGEPVWYYEIFSGVAGKCFIKAIVNEHQLHGKVHIEHHKGQSLELGRATPMFDVFEFNVAPKSGSFDPMNWPKIEFYARSVARDLQLDLPRPNSIALSAPYMSKQRAHVLLHQAADQMIAGVPGRMLHYYRGGYSDNMVIVSDRGVRAQLTIAAVTATPQELQAAQFAKVPQLPPAASSCVTVDMSDPDQHHGRIFIRTFEDSGTACARFEELHEQAAAKGDGNPLAPENYGAKSSRDADGGRDDLDYNED